MNFLCCSLKYMCMLIQGVFKKNSSTALLKIQEAFKDLHVAVFQGAFQVRVNHDA